MHHLINKHHQHQQVLTIKKIVAINVNHQSLDQNPLSLQYTKSLTSNFLKTKLTEFAPYQPQT